MGLAENIVSYAGGVLLSSTSSELVAIDAVVVGGRINRGYLYFPLSCTSRLILVLGKYSCLRALDVPNLERHQ